ncbi:hypothetical protein BGZ49_010884 [Haplosporangium sp. Z 27]|nr:hypothetical protein BGZ49_010884 [Haplosporangium sp. Z 27]
MSQVLPSTREQGSEQPLGIVGSFKANVEDRLRSFKSGFRLGELSGSLGDLGTLLPIMLSLSLTGQVDLTASLIFGGLWNIFTGLAFRMPMCVQPMKCKFQLSKKKNPFNYIVGLFVNYHFASLNS